MYMFELIPIDHTLDSCLNCLNSYRQTCVQLELPWTKVRRLAVRDVFIAAGAPPGENLYIKRDSNMKLLHVAILCLFSLLTLKAVAQEDGVPSVRRNPRRRSAGGGSAGETEDGV